MRVFNIFVNITICVTCYGRGALPIYDGRLDSDLNANNFSITNLYSLDVKNVPWATTNQLDAALEGIVVAESDPVAGAALAGHTAASNPHGITPAGIGALPLDALSAVQGSVSNALALAEGALTTEADTLETVTARGATTTSAVTIGSRGVGAVSALSFANGQSVVASGDFSHAEGDDTTASGPASHAEGRGTAASGFFSHAEGDDTTASGPASHAEGRGTAASGDFSHAEGDDTTASGPASHAEGGDTTASEYYSHASGFKSVASNIVAFAWQGSDGYAEPKYGSHGNGSFNINPVGGLAGLWIGETNMAATLSGYATTGAVAAVQAAMAGKVSTNHVGDVVVTGNVSATSFIGDGSQLSGVSGGVAFPEMIIYSSGATTSIPFTKDYKYYQVVATNTTDIVFDYTGLGDFTSSVLEFQIRLVLTNPLVDAVTIPTDGVAGIKYVGDIDISATVNNTVQHLGMMMYSTNNVLLSHWFFDEPLEP